MFISLYTSRVVLDILGETDFGIYTLVGGIVSIFTVMSGSLSNSIQRFLNIGLGKDDISETKRYFTQGLSIFIILIAVFFILGESVGLWFVIDKLNYPPERLSAVFWVYQFSLFSVLLGIFQIPFSGAIIAREKMGVFAIASIVDVLLRLVIVILLYSFGSFDNLIVYALSIAVMQICISAFYLCYSSIKFPECTFKIEFKRDTAREIGKFMGFSFFGSSTYTVTQQGINVIMNLFWGAAINAARGIATQVSTAMIRFVNCITVPMNPQIVQSYAVKNYENLHYLVERSTKYSLYMMIILSTPLIFEARIVIDTWLKVVPDYAILFTQLTVIEALVITLQMSSSVAVSATGKLLKLEVWGRLIVLSVLPVAYLLIRIFHCGATDLAYSGVKGGPMLLDLIYNPKLVFPALPLLLLVIAQLCYAFYIIADMVNKINLNFKSFWNKALKQAIGLFLILWIVCGIEVYIMPDDLIRFFVVGFSTVIIAMVYARKDIMFVWDNFIKKGYEQY